MTSRRRIRQSIRQLRNTLSPTEQSQAADALVLQCATNPIIQKANTIAVYLSSDGEVDTDPLIQWLWQQGKQVSLPVIHPFAKGHLLFLEYTKTTLLIHNKYQILEPKLDKTKIVPTSELDLILTPLVAFDHTGNRLGMGGGYYDRTLSRWHTDQQGPMPIGLSHSCQQVPLLPIESWDVPLPQIITPKKTWFW
ncbi:5-formyltetrahydrofolate cyclo-ligase [Aliivibrio sp. S4TY2]|uniref:5-formyltetrahydrofolate cyclo-ligase n=1 Tax=unclassified Aliivibrio TaxID=2645654 RepID=UPI00237977E1|nr:MULTISPECIES: 5-formyltetrahydrofolate cyclo-ligase [unclassified Aliivibrio]MDD9155042.1 5-formyltetrahydrofolate cyclo-ligase [Aliivibrio sp. S4TY2]MDD9158595.1 5-formyltetrahydrofolate cyclo-ligase [Aliivibrio sp. S4TY1]MDD9163045.1 5-formyltetrahydrofolate cyclo-ligase [Aliivibrio sp. S4MY2]MDD9166594.1 5-formyltetrahydrofolate cyclo-ligase [Aliivibrio sp. S4MY4]MDD9184122.1 5-formyltetrahydrofolate cyclo-ligase [Aliivibrio sp. S4MY3]